MHPIIVCSTQPKCARQRRREKGGGGERTPKPYLSEDEGQVHCAEGLHAAGHLFRRQLTFVRVLYCQLVAGFRL